MFFVHQYHFEKHRIFFLKRMSFVRTFILLSIHDHMRHFQEMILFGKIIQYVSIIL